MAKMSLQEQMLKAGLINNKQAKKAQKGSKKSKELSREVKASVEAKKAEQIARDKALNQQQQAEKTAREIQAQIKQLIESNTVSSSKADIKYNFKDGNTIKSIYVGDSERKQLISGVLVIAKFADQYSVIPAIVGRKIKERDTDIIIENEHSEEVPAEDDPYADFVVPDDLMW